MIEIIDNIEMPAPPIRRGKRGLKFPLDKLEVNQGFIIPECDAEWSTGTLKTGTIKRFSAIHKQASYYGKKWGKEFQCATNEDRSVSVKRLK